MFMQRIEIPVEVSPEPKPAALKLAVGTLFILFSALVMAPYLAGLFLWIAAHAVARTIGKMLVSLYESVVYAGEMIVGR